MDCVLGKHDEIRRKEQAIYYVRKKFIEYKVRYNIIEKLCCGIV